MLVAFLMGVSPFSVKLHGFGVLIFFVLSGYLITGSFVRSGNLWRFFCSRALRIFPALILAVFFCAYCLGPLVTTLSVEEYLSSNQTWNYFKYNTLLYDGIRFRLPGVFEELPRSGGVNGSLWTLPIELLMYFYVAVLGIAGVLCQRVVFKRICYSSSNTVCHGA